MLVDSYSTVHRATSRNALSEGLGDFLNTYVVRHLGTLVAFLSIQSVMHGPTPAANTAELGVSALHLLVNCGLAFRYHFMRSV